MYVGTTARSLGGNIEVAVLIDGQEQPLYRRPWDGKYFVVGPPGQPYTLRVRSLHYGRIEVLNSVDGRNTLNDERADMHVNTGLVFGGRTTGEFDGWRLNDNQVNAFVFGTPGHADRHVAVQATGSTDNIGVIGFAVYRERDDFRLGGLALRGTTRGGHGAYGDESFVPKGGPATLGGEMFATRGGSIGTDMGETRTSRVGRTTFTRDGSEPDVLAIGYDTEAVLRELGIVAPAEANPFPGLETGYRQYRTV